MADDKIEREDGEFFSLEDGGGVVLLESGVSVAVVHDGPNLWIRRYVRMEIKR